jgi:monoamine oxidase
LTLDDPTNVVDWHALEGFSDVLIQKMLSTLHTPPVYNHRVTSVAEDGPSSMRVSVSGKQDEFFSHVFSTSTFANLRNIKTEGVSMTYKQRQAIRTLHYGPAVKVGIKFKTRWWERGYEAARRL